MEMHDLYGVAIAPLGISLATPPCQIAPTASGDQASPREVTVERTLEVSTYQQAAFTHVIQPDTPSAPPPLIFLAAMISQLLALPQQQTLPFGTVPAVATPAAPTDTAAPGEQPRLAGLDSIDLDEPAQVDGEAIVRWLETGEGEPWPERS